jgi:hypothetical protein
MAIPDCIIECPCSGTTTALRVAPRRANALVLNTLGDLTLPGTPPAPYRAMIRHLKRPSFSRFSRILATAVFGIVVSGAVAEAQRPVPVKPRPKPTQQSREQVVPPAFYPPAGMCRIWINEVPAGQQPAPTDCASAVRNRPANGKVLFGDDPPKAKKGKPQKDKSSPTDELVDLINRRISR